MSKRKHKHKYRQFAPQPPAVPDPQQPQLPLVSALAPETDSMNVNANPPHHDSSHATLAAAETGAGIATAATDAVQVDSTCADAVEPKPDAAALTPEIEESLGQRLRAAREARGLSREDAAHALKLPTSVLKALETEQYERIGHGVFLRGYLVKYLQLLDLPQALAGRVATEHAELPPLQTSGTISHPRYLIERYSGSALYLILTGVIVVPAVLLAMRVGFDRDLARIAPLDVPTMATVATSGLSAPPAAVVETHAGPLPVPQPKLDEAPLIASMTPFPAPAAPAPVAAANRIHLSLTQPSWVEVSDSDGKKLEYGLLPAGSTRDYSSNLPLDIRIGNVGGASLDLAGKPLDLDTFRRANVAHLKIADGAAVPTHSGG